MTNKKDIYEKNKEVSRLAGVADAATDKMIDHLMDQARNLHNSKHETRKKLLKLAWGVAGGLGGVCVAQAVALAVMMPLKQTEPILVTTYQDGYAEVIRDFKDPLVFSEEVDRYFLKEYVSNREMYDWNKIQYLVDYTQAWSAPHVYDEYYAHIVMPSSNLNVLKDRARIDVNITSMSLNKKAGMATIRLTKTPKQATGRAMEGVVSTNWIVELKYQQNFKQNNKDKSFNPLGYEVTSYTLVQEKGLQ